MSWLWEQLSGRLYHNGELVGVGYSGAGQWKNDPASQFIKDKGPIPCGFYVILEPRDTFTHGAYVLPLMPDPANDMGGRGGFLIHGDSVVSPGNASEGCVVLAKGVREEIWESQDHNLRVVSGAPVGL